MFRRYFFKSGIASFVLGVCPNINAINSLYILSRPALGLEFNSPYVRVERGEQLHLVISKTGNRKTRQETRRFQGQEGAGKDFDRLSTVLSNWGWAFIFNRRGYGGGHLAEGRRQRAAGAIAKTARIAKDCRFENSWFYADWLKKIGKRAKGSNLDPIERGLTTKEQ